MSNIKRINVEKRYSDVAVYNGVAYLAGQVPHNTEADIVGQTHQVLQLIDQLLADSGTDKSKILMAQIFLSDLADYDGMNSAWDEWVAVNNAPPRATVQAKLAHPLWKVEIVVTAAVP